MISSIENKKLEQYFKQIKKEKHISPYAGMTYAIHKTHTILNAILEAESFHATIFF